LVSVTPAAETTLESAASGIDRGGCSFCSELVITGILVGGAGAAAAGDAADEAKELVLELRGKLRHGRRWLHQRLR